MSVTRKKVNSEEWRSISRPSMTTETSSNCGMSRSLGGS